MKYALLSSESFRELEREVEWSLADGWLLQGGVSSFVKNGRIFVVQAMVKPEE